MLSHACVVVCDLHGSCIASKLLAPCCVRTQNQQCQKRQGCAWQGSNTHLHVSPRSLSKHKSTTLIQGAQTNPILLQHPGAWRLMDGSLEYARSTCHEWLHSSVHANRDCIDHMGCAAVRRSHFRPVVECCWAMVVPAIQWWHVFSSKGRQMRPCTAAWQISSAEQPHLIQATVLQGNQLIAIIECEPGRVARHNCDSRHW